MTAVLMAVQALATTSRELGVAKLNLEVISVRPAHLAVAAEVPTLQVRLVMTYHAHPCLALDD